MTVVVATVFPLPSHRSAMQAALARAIPAVHEEPGCELYALHEGPDRFVLVEKWSTGEALAIHAAAPALATLRSELSGLTKGDLDIQVLAPKPAGRLHVGAL